MHYFRSGSGRPLLLLHGLGGNWRSWSPILAALTAHRDVIARTPIEKWYAEELFARFAVLEADPLFGIEPTVP